MVHGYIQKSRNAIFLLNGSTDPESLDLIDNKGLDVQYQ